MLQSKINIQLLLKWSCLLLFIGSALKNYWFFPSYFDVLFFNDWFAEFIINGISGDLSIFIESFNKYTSIIINGLLIQAVLLGFLKKGFSSVSLMLGWISVLVIFMAEWNGHNYQFGFFLENLLKIGLVPVYIFLELRNKDIYKILLLFAACTFAGHGLYALNILPRPGYFVDMIMKVLPVSEASGVSILNLIGVFDLMVILLIYFKPLQKWVILYMIVWGFLTSFARPLLNFSWVFLTDSILVWIPEFVVRTSHFLIPFGLYQSLKNEDYNHE